MDWVTLSIISAVALAANTLFITHLSKTTITPTAINFYTFAGVAAFLYVYSVIKKIPLTIGPSSNLLWIGCTIVAIVCIIQSAVPALKKAPNPGYVSGIQSASIIIVALVAYFFMDGDLSKTKIIGMILCLSGAFLLSK